MFDYMIDFGISVVLSLLKQAVKDPARAAELKRVMLKIYTQIGLVYGTDSDFAKVAFAAHNSDVQ